MTYYIFGQIFLFAKISNQKIIKLCITFSILQKMKIVIQDGIPPRLSQFYDSTSRRFDIVGYIMSKRMWKRQFGGKLYWTVIEKHQHLQDFYWFFLIFRTPDNCYFHDYLVLLVGHKIVIFDPENNNYTVNNYWNSTLFNIYWILLLHHCQIN